jgi:hypothetical protein
VVDGAALRGSEGLRVHGGTFLCEERVYPNRSALHITWWGWAFAVDAKTKYEELATAFVGAERDDAALTLRFGRGDGGTPDVVITLEDVGGGRGIPQCAEPLPAGARSRAVVSTMR